MNRNKINQEVTSGNFGLEAVLKEIATNLGAPLITGNIYFVVPADNANSVQFNKYYNTKYEDSTEMVQTTLALALAACTADRGDFIFLAPGYALTVTATNVDLNKAGVTIIGLGNGLKRPTFTFGAAAATMTVSAANVTVKNCHHIGNFLDVAAAYTLAAAKDFRLENNTFVDTSASLGFLSIVVTNATDNDADGLSVVGNFWYSLDVSPNAFISILAAELRLYVADNHVDMAATNDVGHFITLAAKIISGARILRNICNVVSSTGAAVGLFLTGSGTTSTGVVAENWVTSLDVTAPLFATAATNLQFFDNKLSTASSTSGKLWPAAMA